ncbi:hypothetical protein BC834DRAFT_454142 [Gloeopeniophorella convolvens]|nr:hypothetical protein BC834DRAFT_454142 [Gloeopeniophorella convolvens]
MYFGNAYAFPTHAPEAPLCDLSKPSIQLASGATFALPPISAPILAPPYYYNYPEVYLRPVAPDAPSTMAKAKTHKQARKPRSRPAAKISSPRVSPVPTPIFIPILIPPFIDVTVEEIIIDCPAVDILLGGRTTSRCSTRDRGNDPNHVPRPPNAFMIFRSYIRKKYLRREKKKEGEEEEDEEEEKRKKSLANISVVCGKLWKVRTLKAPFREVATLAKYRHAQLHPDYKYSPSPRTDKSPEKGKSTQKGKAPTSSRKKTASSRKAAAPMKRVVRFASVSSASLDDAPAEAASRSPTPSLSASSMSDASRTPPVSPHLMWPLLPPLSLCLSSESELGYPSGDDMPGIPPRPCMKGIDGGAELTDKIPELDLYTYAGEPNKYDRASSLQGIPADTFQLLKPENSTLAESERPIPAGWLADEVLSSLCNMSVDEDNHLVAIRGNPEASFISFGLDVGEPYSSEPALSPLDPIPTGLWAANSTGYFTDFNTPPSHAAPIEEPYFPSPEEEQFINDFTYHEDYDFPMVIDTSSN